jgi:hypothetical protein
MTIFLAIGLGVVALLLVARLFLVSHPASLARIARFAGPVALVLVGLALVAVGRVAFGVPAAAAGLLWGALQFRRRPRGRAISAKASVRTAAIEMDLDRRNGALDGIVLAGRHVDRSLASLSLDELLEVWEDLSTDPESRRLLEAYLDGRFPVWRERAKAHGRPGQRGAPGAGAMTEQEAYEILGLEAGASAADIRKAHRRLVQRLDPGIAADSLLVARIDKAKAILLAKHG